MVARFLSMVIAAVTVVSGCTKMRDDLDYDFEVEQTWVTDDTGTTIVQFTSVPYQPQNTAILRNEIIEAMGVDSRRVLELGSGTGYFAIRCAEEGAKQVVVLAPTRAIHACVRYNVALAEQDSVVETRLVDPTAASVLSAIPATERFDYVAFNTETTMDEEVTLAAIEQLPNWLRGGGKGWVICETEQTKDAVTDLCRKLGFQFAVIKNTDKSLRIDPDAFPQTLQIDPFTPDAKTPAAKTPVAKTPVAKTPAAKAPAVVDDSRTAAEQNGDAAQSPDEKSPVEK